MNLGHPSKTYFTDFMKKPFGVKRALTDHVPTSRTGGVHDYIFVMGATQLQSLQISVLLFDPLYPTMCHRGRYRSYNEIKSIKSLRVSSLRCVFIMIKWVATLLDC